MFRRSAIIIILGFLSFAAMLPAPFRVMDDRLSIVDNPTIQSFHHIPRIFHEGYFHDQSYYRPLISLSFMAEYHAYKFNSFFYNLDNLILHILNALLVFLLVMRLTKSVSIGFWTGLLFAIHPIQWEAVCNIQGRAILLSAFFVLNSFILFIEFYKSRQFYCLGGSLILFFLGLLCKESTAVLPLVILAFLTQDKFLSWFQRIKYIGPFLIALIGYFFIRVHVGIIAREQINQSREVLLAFITFLTSVVTDLRLFILPIDLHLDRCLPVIKGLGQPMSIMICLFWLAILGGVIFCFRKINSLIMFLLLWFCIELIPVSQLLASIQVGVGHISTAEHFLYLVSIPVLIGIVLSYQKILEINMKMNFTKPVFLRLIAGAFMVFLFLTAVEQSIYASNEFNMVTRSLSFEPNNPRLQGVLGMLFIYKNDIPDAKIHFQEAIKIEPFNPTYHIKLGTILCQQGKWIEGLAQFVVYDPGQEKDEVLRQEALTMIHIRQQIAQGVTFGARGWLTIGIEEAQNHHIDEAIDAFLKSVQINPSQSDAWLNLGSLYEVKQNWPLAKGAFQKLLGIHNLTPFQKDFALKHLSALEHR